MVDVNGYVVGMILVPAVLGFFKGEIMGLLADLKIYKTKGVHEGSEIEILNPHIGSWAAVRVLDYTWNFSAADRVVTFKHLDGSGRVESVPFKDWFNFRKATKEA